MKEFLHSVAIQIRHGRESKKIGQQELAMTLGIGLRTYQRIESGETIPTLDVLYSIAKMLEIKICELVNPSLVLNRLSNFRPFFVEEEHHFIDEKILASNIIALSTNQKLIHYLENNQIENVMSLKEFFHSEYCLVVSCPRWTILNAKSKKALNTNLSKVATTSGHHCKKHLGEIWAVLLNENIKFFHTITWPEILKKKYKMLSRCIVIKRPKGCFVLSMIEIEKSPQSPFFVD